MKRIITVKPPSRYELLTLRLMILLGVISMGFFVETLLSTAVRGNLILYVMLVVYFGFYCLKILHEWVHYFFITVPPTPLATKKYSVDIFTTFCAGEPYQMLVETLTALQEITYPHETYLCDEADDPYLKALCEKLGVHHVTRSLKIDAKAGNINNALRQSKGELCVVLDPDHVPSPEFLDPIVSHFDNPQVGFVQIVQAYKNHEESLIAKGAAQQTYQFYGPMMMTMNKYGTVQAIGANCTFRRTALESIGGHAAGLAEDMHTSMQLHARGWKSVYVPAVLARGLVPSTLSAYYQQQLKWSRGVFDLLVTAYPKLFSQFTWQQKLHYAFIPLHYASGLIFLINFLIPIIALFFNESPVYINLVEFGLILLPLVSAIVLIRHFVQWWVMEDEERGFHVVGGLLMIGTWWVFIGGFVYTILRKKVPYVPTPKEGNEDSNWLLNVPNMLIFVISLTAIIYGLYTDWNPYNLAMAGFALMNCLFMSFVIIASRQQHIKRWNKGYSDLNVIMMKIKKLKGHFWIFRRRIYEGVRSTAIIITVMLVACVAYLNNIQGRRENPDFGHLNPKDIFLLGLQVPVSQAGPIGIKQSQGNFNIHPDIIALDSPWGSKLATDGTFAMLDSVYERGALPMISWIQMDSTSKKPRDKYGLLNSESVFKQISKGAYDDYILNFATRVRSLKRPIFVYFSQGGHLTYTSGDTNTKMEEGEAFGIAWRHICDLFHENGADNVIWVWSPSPVKGAERFFPGKDYVDWVAITTQNRSAKLPYLPNLSIPVMVIESKDSLSSNDASDSARIVEMRKMPGVKGIVLSQSAFARSTSGNGGRYFDKGMIDEFSPGGRLLSNIEKPKTEQRAPASLNAFNGLRGVNYIKGQNWTKNLDVFTRDELLVDLSEMKAMGINTIKHYGPGIYDRNILNAAETKEIKVQYGFYISDEIDFLNDTDQLSRLTSTIVNTVYDLRDRKEIVSWNIGNAVFQKLSKSYYKPELMYQQDAYLSWVKNLVAKIKEADKERPVTLDVNAGEDTHRTVRILGTFVPQIDAYGLILKKDVITYEEIKAIKQPCFISYATVSVYQKFASKRIGSFISSWQDEQWTDRVHDDGLKDFQGRDKLSLLKLKSLWSSGEMPGQVPKVKILRPATGTFPGTQLAYHALIRKSDGWVLANKVKGSLKFEWKLARTDGYENPVSIREVGKGPSLQLVIPENPSFYRLYLYVIQNNTILAVYKSTLNTPLGVASR